MSFQSLLQKRTSVLILYGVKYENDNERNVFRYKSWIDVTVQLWTHTINSSVTKPSVRAARPAQLQVRSGNLFLGKKTRRRKEKKLKCTQTDLYANNAGLSWWSMASLSAHFRSNKHRNISFSSLLERHRRKVWVKQMAQRFQMCGHLFYTQLSLLYWKVSEGLVWARFQML